MRLSRRFRSKLLSAWYGTFELCVLPRFDLIDWVRAIAGRAIKQYGENAVMADVIDWFHSIQGHHWEDIARKQRLTVDVAGLDGMVVAQRIIIVFQIGLS